MEPTTRPARIEDAAGIATVRVKSWQAGYSGHFPEAYLQGMDIQTNANKTKARLLKPKAGVTDWVAEVEHTVVGWACTGSQTRDHDAGPHIAELAAIYVLPKYWGTGLGYVLMDVACADLESRGAREIMLWVLEGNERAERFYGRQGFSLDGGRKPVGLFPELDLWEVRYRRSVSTI